MCAPFVVEELRQFDTLSPILERKPLSTAVSPPVVQSSGIRYRLTSDTFNPLAPSKLH